MKRHDAVALTTEEIQELGDLLRKRREELTAARSTHLLDARYAGDRTLEVGDRAEQEIGADANDARANVERVEIAEIEHALAKIDAGTYGVSEESGEPIGVARLRIVPTTRMTVREQEALEHGR